MSSSDSDDDCYGNIAQKLQTIKSTYKEEKGISVVLNDTSEQGETSAGFTKPEENTSEIVVEDCNVTANILNSTDNDEFSLDAIIANNSKQKPGRGRGRGRGRGAKRKIADETSEPAERVTRASKRKTSNSTGGRTSPVTDPATNPVPNPEIAPVEENTTAASRGRGGRARGSRGRNSTARSTASPRGRRGRRNNCNIFDFLNVYSQHFTPSSSYPTYSVGNTEEYPDQCDNQQLFATRTVNTDVEIIEDADPLEDDNEEMSVKVYWQSLEIFKFKIRKYQKLTQIFDYFTEKEGVSNDKLLFTYNDRILKIGDTPESINYSIAKFIDGGVVNQNITELTKENNREIVNNGLKIKFQCQNKKKPFETTLRAEDKLALAMMKCAEHLETPLERLKFYFDGDLITNKTTPQELELEGGECIDVKICS